MRIDRIEIDGIAALDAQLARLGTAVATEIGEEAVRASAELVREGWEKAAPYDPAPKLHQGRDYGHLRENMKVEKVKSIKASWIGYRVSTGNAFWGRFLEFGTRFMAARPWARPVLDALRPAIVAKQVEVINQGIAQAVGKSK